MDASGGAGEQRFAALAALAAGLRDGRLARAADLALTCEQLGALCVPVLVRSLAGAAAQQALAHRLLVSLPPHLHPRVVAELRSLQTAGDHAKAAAQRVQLELGRPVDAALRLHDPEAIQRQLAQRLAAQLEQRADVAAAADLMVTRLAPTRLVELALIVAEHAPAGAAALATELASRIELPADLRVSLLRAVAAVPRHVLPAAEVTWSRLLTRPVDGASIVAVIGGAPEHGRRALVLWRGADGTLARAWYDDAASVARVTREALRGAHAAGYRPVDHELPALHAIAATAARASVRAGGTLPSAYFLGRDLLGLSDEHLGDRLPWSPARLLHGLGVERLAGRDAAGARAALERAAALAPDDADIASNLGLCLLALGDVDDGARWLARARDLEPSFAMHHWNHAAAAHQLGAAAPCVASMRAYLALTAGHAADTEHAGRRAQAQAMVDRAASARATRRTRRRPAIAPTA
jgi:tetratricopeptide (TPR) repeat protein